MLSIDAGRFAPMTYNFQQHQTSLGMAGSGFANRGKADNIRKISIPTLPTISTSSYDDEMSHMVPTPRTSTRAQLLAGLRTAPKTPTSATATFSDTSMNVVPESPQYSAQMGRQNANGFPLKSTRSFGFNGLRNTGSQPTNQVNIPRSSPPQQAAQESFFAYQQNNLTGLPTPPASNVNFPQSDSEYEAKVYAELLARNISLAQQQQLLQQQMRIVQQAQQLQQVQQQMQQLQMQSPVNNSFSMSPVSPAVYSPSVSGLANSAYYNMYSPVGAQYHYFQQQNRPQAGQPQTSTPTSTSQAPLTIQTSITPSLSPPANKSPAYTPPARRSPSPPKEVVKSELANKKTPSPPPAPSASFRRGHKKCSSLSSCINANTLAVTDNGPKTSVPKFVNVPSTPVNSTFGGRGDHPIRQPRGPPSLEEIVAKPTTKHEGSKNFATRQRRSALTKLVNAGMERRGAKSSASSAGSMTPVSENEIILNFEDADSNESSVHGDSSVSTPISSADEGISMSKPTMAFKRRSGLRVPQFALDSAEKRKSALF